MRAVLIKTASLLVFAAFVQAALCDEEAGLEAKVIEVVDAATIIVSYRENPTSCVYIGVSVPEPENQTGSISSRAAQFNRSLVEGKTVRLEFDARRYDKYGRLLAYVYCGDVFVNAELLRQGYGSIMIVSPNTKYAEYFLKLENESREAKQGLWAEPDMMDNPTQDIVFLGNQIKQLEKEIDELKKKMDYILELIMKLQSQPTGDLSVTSQGQGKKASQVNPEQTDKQTHQTVYITNSGKKYHNLGCRHLTEGYKAINIEEAKKKGYQPCSVCFPDKNK